MANAIDIMAADAAAELMETFGDQGGLLLIVGGKSERVDAAITDERLAIEEDSQGNEIKLARRTAVVTRAALAAKGFYDLPLRTTAKVGEHTYTLDPNATQWGAGAVTIGLERTNLSRINPLESGSQ